MIVRDQIIAVVNALTENIPDANARNIVRGSLHMLLAATPEEMLTNFVRMVVKPAVASHLEALNLPVPPLVAELIRSVADQL